jgi:hypothetical protein
MRKSTALPGLIKELLRPLAACVFGPMGWLEDKLLPDYQLCYSPVFIVGPPRSGTTLLSQLVNHALATSYFTNLTSRLRVQGIRRPPAVLSAWLAKSLRLTDRRQETFESHYGHTRGWGSPNDTTMVWKHWFPNRFVGVGELTHEARRAVYQVVAGTERVFGRPFVDKSVENSVRIGALVEIFPTALFLRCIRNPLAVAQSIYIGKAASAKRPQDWWFSTRPKEFDNLRHKRLIEQVTGQVYFLERNIAEGLAVVLPKHILSVDYRSVCLNPQREVSRIEDFMNHHGATTEQIRPVPLCFPFSHARRIDVATYQALIDHLERLYGHEMTRLDEPL